jgi:RND family efflux transporter MFP subunit
MSKHKQFQKMHFSRPLTNDQVPPPGNALENGNIGHASPMLYVPSGPLSHTLPAQPGLPPPVPENAIRRDTEYVQKPFDVSNSGQLWMPPVPEPGTRGAGAATGSTMSSMSMASSTIHTGEVSFPPSGGAQTEKTGETEEASADLLDTRLTPSIRRKRNLRFIAVAALAILLVGATSLWIGRKGSTDVTLYSVGGQNVSEYIGGGGIVYPAQQLAVSYPVTERVINVLVKPGQQVTVNQPLVQLDPAELNAQLLQAQSDVQAAQSYLNTVQALGNRLTIAQAQQAYNVAKSRYDALAAQMASPLLHNGNLISPMKGIVTSVNVNPGDVFPAGKSLLTIIDESTVIVRVRIPLSNLAQVHTGEAATVTPSSVPGVTLNGTVSVIVPVADTQTDTFEAWISVTNSENVLLPGMSAFVRIEQATKALVVPRLAVLNPDREGVVFVVHNDCAYIQPVHIIGRSPDALFVDSGLAPGDKVVLIGLATLQNGQPVHVTGVES